MIVSVLHELVPTWQERASFLRETAAAEGPARAIESCITELEGALRDSMLETLTLEQAEVESGYTGRHLRKLIRDETIPNVGVGGDVRIQRMHLPKKPGFGVASYNPEPPSSRVQAARAVALGEE